MNRWICGSARLCAALGLALAGCGGERGDPGAIRVDTLDGGTVAVRNPEGGAWAGQAVWRVVEELRIGSTAGGGPDMFAMPAALEVDAHGRLNVLDAQAGQVRVFGPDGRHVRSMGRQGAGPGEMAQPMGMALAPDGALWVVDPANARFTVFDTAGVYRETIPRLNGYASYPWPGRFDRQGRLWDVGSGAGAPGAPPVLLRTDPASGRMERFPLPAFAPRQFISRRGAITNTAPVPFSPRLAWVLDGEGRVWSGVPDAYRLRLHEPGGDTLRVVERAAAPVAVSAAERDSVPLQLKWFTDQGGAIDLAQVPRTKPAYLSIRVDDRGWLWLRPSVPAGEPNAAFDVFEPEGRYQGRVSLPVAHADEMPLVVRGDRIYAVVLNEEGVPQVVRFRIEGRGPSDARTAASSP